MRDDERGRRRFWFWRGVVLVGLGVAALVYGDSSWPFGMKLLTAAGAVGLGAVGIVCSFLHEASPVALRSAAGYVFGSVLVLAGVTSLLWPRDGRIDRLALAAILLAGGIAVFVLTPKLKRTP